MRIDVEALPLETKYPFKIARGEKQRCETFIFHVECEGVGGIGEASPQVYYGETGDTLQEAVRRIRGKTEGAPAVLRESLLRGPLRKKLRRNASVRAAIDMALWDIEGKMENKPCYRMLDLDPSRTPVTSFTIGFDRPDVVDKKLEDAAAFPILKMKMGIPGDLALLDRAIRRTGKKIRVDANEGWDLDTALLLGRELAERGIEFMEQPIPHHKQEELSTLKRLSPLHVILDESIINPEDVESCKSQGHGINIKLMKCGGITPAIELIKEARRVGLSVMLGCMIETSVAITAAAHLSPMVDYADLDGNLLIKKDPYDGVRVEEGKLILPAGNGLGVVERKP